MCFYLFIVFFYLCTDYLKETVHDTFRFVSVSPKGIKFLSADKMDGIPLVLQLTAKMIDLEEHGSSQHKEGGGLNHVPTSCVNQILL